MVAALYISLSLLSKTYSMGTDAISGAAAESLLSQIVSSANEICAMGEGNTRIIEAKIPFSLSYSGGLLSLSHKGRSFSLPVRCEIEVWEREFEGAVLLAGRGNSVYVGRFPPE